MCVCVCVDYVIRLVSHGSSPKFDPMYISTIKNATHKSGERIVRILPHVVASFHDVAWKDKFVSGLMGIISHSLFLDCEETQKYTD